MLEKEYYTKEEVAIITNMRSVWQSHNFWMRSLIISMIHDLGDVEFVKNRLLDKPLEITEEIRPYVGDENADILEGLLIENILILEELIRSLKENDLEGVVKNKFKWYSLADKVNNFMSDKYPKWNGSEGEELLYDSYNIIVIDIIKRLNGQYEEDINLFDLADKKAIQIADFISEFIIKQELIK